MSVASGYVHISVRNANKATGNTGHNVKGLGPAYSAHPGYGAPTAPGYGYDPSVAQAGYGPLRTVPAAADGPVTAPTPVVSGGEGLRGVGPDNVARGFVLYVGVDEDSAAAAGTSLAKLAQDIAPTPSPWYRRPRATPPSPSPRPMPMEAPWKSSVPPSVIPP